MMVAVGGSRLVAGGEQLPHHRLQPRGGASSRSRTLDGGERAAEARPRSGPRARVTERDRQLQIEKAAQSELARSVAQLQEENAALKEDLGLPAQHHVVGGHARRARRSRTSRSSATASRTSTATGCCLPRAGSASRTSRGGSRSWPGSQPGRRDDHAHRSRTPRRAEAAGRARVPLLPEGRRALHAFPRAPLLKSVDIRVFALPGGQVKLSRTVNFQ